MKQYIKSLLGVAALLSVAVISGCKKEFFNRPPDAGISVGNYYQTTAQVQTSTNVLYGSPWFGWNNKAGWAITELAGGNGRTYSSDVVAFFNFSVGNTNPEILAAWDSPYSVIAQSNGILNNLPAAVPASVPTAVVNNALGEAHLMRATAYFYLVRVFGNVPIIENPLIHTGDFGTVPTNPIADVYKFIIRDLQFAETNCSANVATTGHGSSGSASAMLAKVYLYMQDYDNARKEAEKVINSGEFQLLPNFNNLFLTANNNNKESILAMQWIYNGGYDFGNSIQASWAYSSAITTTSDGYGVLGPTFDLQSAFKAEGGDTSRRHATIMLPGSKYTELNQGGAGPYILPLNGGSAGAHASPKKYVVGSPQDNGGKSANQASGNNTYIMRYADVLLIEAEAAMGQEAGAKPGKGIDTNYTTRNATTLQYLNLVRQRSGVQAATSISYKDLLRERRLEFALEQDYWFDLCRIDGYNVTSHPVATNIIQNQERGGASTGTAAANYLDYTIYSQKFVPAYFVFPIPVNETTADPNLLNPPVPYVFK
ncbi:MAG: RagB/SusD family nutrient uptake outer membrane protein [Sphingobacteriaceae bacterium]|nr:MAG: RagB/SusD family nutrient uptake outer membrane protein [Sphingobacteriaceae bacterium]